MFAKTKQILLSLLNSELDSLNNVDRFHGGIEKKENQISMLVGMEQFDCVNCRNMGSSGKYVYNNSDMKWQCNNKIFCLSPTKCQSEFESYVLRELLR